jgi:hypothetical protein
MKTPERIQPLIEEGLVDEVICQLMGGKEAMVYVVRCSESIRCAKVYKEIDRRSFRHSIDYTEGRREKTAAALVPLARRLDMDAKRGMTDGRVLRWILCIALLLLACPSRNPITYSRACC